MKQITDFQKPARYVGGEYGMAEMKPNAYRFCLCFPDVYEVGMSNLGTRILYYTVNEGDVANCERCYTPWPDYGNELRATGTPLVSLETKQTGATWFWRSVSWLFGGLPPFVSFLHSRSYGQI